MLFKHSDLVLHAVPNCFSSSIFNCIPYGYINSHCHYFIYFYLFGIFLLYLVHSFDMQIMGGCV